MDPVQFEDLKAFLALNRLKIDGRRRVVTLLAEGKTAHEVFEQITSEDFLKELVPSEGGQAFVPEKEIELCAAKKIDFLTFTDPGYPWLLKEISDPPLVLYRKGNLEKADQNSIAIVGTRHPSFYGRSQAKRFAKELAAKGLTVVSGLARGIDQAAHEAALEISYGRTIAVLGSGLDVIYPKENERLYERISVQGAVLSEYPLGMPPLPENFPRRNRILSGLSCGVLVVEAHSRSGSLITAHQAVEQGREVFSLPGPVDQLTSRGTHQLLKEGACLVEAPEDIFLILADGLKWENKFKPAMIEQPLSLQVPGDEMRQSFPPRLSQANGGTEIDKKILATEGPQDEEGATIETLLKEEGPLAQDEILEFTGLEPLKLPALLLRLELAKKLKRTQDGKYGLLM